MHPASGAPSHDRGGARLQQRQDDLDVLALLLGVRAAHLAVHAAGGGAPCVMKPAQAGMHCCNQLCDGIQPQDEAVLLQGVRQTTLASAHLADQVQHRNLQDIAPVGHAVHLRCRPRRTVHEHGYAGLWRQQGEAQPLCMPKHGALQRSAPSLHLLIMLVKNTSLPPTLPTWLNR